MREIYINSIQFSGRRVTSLINIGGYNETIETTINVHLEWMWLLIGSMLLFVVYCTLQ